MRRKNTNAIANILVYYSAGIEQIVNHIWIGGAVKKGRMAYQWIPPKPSFSFILLSSRNPHTSSSASQEALDKG